MKRFALILVLLTGCFDADEIIPPRADSAPDAQVQVLTGLHVSGPYTGVYQEGITCLPLTLDLTIEDLDAKPTIIERRDMECAFTAGDRWVLQCEAWDMGGLFFHWTYWTLDLDALAPHHGEFYWEVDGLPHFYCVRSFLIDDVTPEYTHE